MKRQLFNEIMKLDFAFNK